MDELLGIMSLERDPHRSRIKQLIEHLFNHNKI
jgi:hypothetical protein